jgi:hypothetical protein
VKMTFASGRPKSLALIGALSGSLLMLGSASALAAPASGPVISAPHIVTSVAAANNSICADHYWCAFSDTYFNMYTGSGTEWIWKNYSYNYWYYVGNAQNDKWFSFASGRGWTTGIGLNYPESNGNIWACVGGGAQVGYPPNFPGTSTSEQGNISSINFFSTSNVFCP